MARPRLRDLGIAVGQLPPGRYNAITDVAGVRVGHATVIHDTPSVARTGVTAIWPAATTSGSTPCSPAFTPSTATAR